MPLSAAMMNGSLVSDTSPSSTVSGMSLSAAFSWALASPGQLDAQAASMRKPSRFTGLMANAFVMAGLSVGCAEASLRAGVSQTVAFVVRDVLIRPGIRGAIERNASIADEASAAVFLVADLQAPVRRRRRLELARVLGDMRAFGRRLLRRDRTCQEEGRDQPARAHQKKHGSLPQQPR